MELKMKHDGGFIIAILIIAFMGFIVYCLFMLATIFAGVAAAGGTLFGGGAAIKNYALSEIAKNIEKRKSEIFEANNKDLENAKELLNNKKMPKKIKCLVTKYVDICENTLNELKKYL